MAERENQKQRVVTHLLLAAWKPHPSPCESLPSRKNLTKSVSYSIPHSFPAIAEGLLEREGPPRYGKVEGEDFPRPHRELSWWPSHAAYGVGGTVVSKAALQSCGLPPHLQPARLPSSATAKPEMPRVA